MGKGAPESGVVAWLAEVEEDRVFISVVTLAELRHGIERMAAGRRRERLEEWLRDELPARFEGPILPVDSIVADAWGKVVAHSEALGRAINAVDAFIAATVETHRLTLVTRNALDFKSSVNTIVNPWIENQRAMVHAFRDEPSYSPSSAVACYRFPDRKLASGGGSLRYC